MSCATPTELQLAGFRLGDNLFAVDIMRIKEIVLPQRLSGMPVTTSALDGMINLRGTVIPVLNLRVRFGMPPNPAGIGKLMIVTLAGRLVALAVDEVEDVITVPVRDLAPVADMVEGVGTEYLVAVCLNNGELYMILNIDALFRSADQHRSGMAAEEIYEHGIV